MIEENINPLRELLTDLKAAATQIEYELQGYEQSAGFLSTHEKPMTPDQREAVLASITNSALDLKTAYDAAKTIFTATEIQ